MRIERRDVVNNPEVIQVLASGAPWIELDTNGDVVMILSDHEGITRTVRFDKDETPIIIERLRAAHKGHQANDPAFYGQPALTYGELEGLDSDHPSQIGPWTR